MSEPEAEAEAEKKKMSKMPYFIKAIIKTKMALEGVWEFEKEKEKAEERVRQMNSSESEVWGATAMERRRNSANEWQICVHCFFEEYE